MKQPTHHALRLLSVKNPINMRVVENSAPSRLTPSFRTTDIPPSSHQVLLDEEALYADAFALCKKACRTILVMKGVLIIILGAKSTAQCHASTLGSPKPLRCSGYL